MAQLAGKVLVIGYGNPGRWDDGLGPALADRLAGARLPGVTVDSDYQLVVEDAAAVAECDVVIFADAAATGPEPFGFEPLQPAAGGAGFSTHALQPGEVLALARDLFGATAAAYVLAIRGYRFDGFGEQLGPAARDNLDQAERFLRGLLTGPGRGLLAHGDLEPIGLTPRAAGLPTRRAGLGSPAAAQESRRAGHSDRLLESPDFHGRGAQAGQAGASPLPPEDRTCKTQSK